MTKLYEEEAGHGFVTCLGSSSMFLAVGYSSGTVVVQTLGTAPNPMAYWPARGSAVQCCSPPRCRCAPH